MGSYQHTQTGVWHHLVVVAGLAMVAAAWFAQNAPAVAAPLGIGGVVLIAVGHCFGTLTIVDEGDRLAVRFGPLPLLGTSIKYTDIASVEPGSTTLIDGWGIHFVPGRGWTYNLRGYGCVVLRVDGRTIRLGTDDAPDLVAFLKERTRG